MKEPEILICGPRSSFPDDRTGQCECGRVIVYRPYVAHIKRKLCIICGLRSMEAEEEPPEIKIHKRVLEELRRFFGAKRN